MSLPGLGGQSFLLVADLILCACRTSVRFYRRSYSHSLNRRSRRSRLRQDWRFAASLREASCSQVRCGGWGRVRVGTAIFDFTFCVSSPTKSVGCLLFPGRLNFGRDARRYTQTKISGGTPDATHKPRFRAGRPTLQQTALAVASGVPPENRGSGAAEIV